MARMCKLCKCALECTRLSDGQTIFMGDAYSKVNEIQWSYPQAAINSAPNTQERLIPVKLRPGRHFKNGYCYIAGVFPATVRTFIG